MEILVGNLPYLTLFGVLFLSGFGLPIPEDIPLMSAGYYCATNDAMIQIMLPVGFASILIADFLVFLMGKRFGHVIPKLPFIRRYLNESRLHRAAEAFHKHGVKIIFMARFLPGLRTPIYFTGGSFGFPAWKMLLMDTAAALLSVPVLVLLPYYFADQIDLILSLLREGQFAVTATLVAVILGFFSLKWLRARERKKQAAAEIENPTTTPADKETQKTTDKLPLSKAPCKS